MSISIVAALGNPGRDYADNRHNLGWVLVDAFARRHSLSWNAQPRFDAELARWDRAPGSAVWFIKPQTFMNDSGRSIGAFLRYLRFSPGELAVVHDDLSIDLGLVKVSTGGSDGGHNGIASIIEHVGPDFTRFRLGIGPKSPPQMDLKDFVLGNFTPEQQLLLQQNLDNTLNGLDLLLAQGVTKAMNQLNRRNSP